MPDGKIEQQRSFEPNIYSDEIRSVQKQETRNVGNSAQPKAPARSSNAADTQQLARLMGGSASSRQCVK